MTVTSRLKSSSCSSEWVWGLSLERRSQRRSWPSQTDSLWRVAPWSGTLYVSKEWRLPELRSSRLALEWLSEAQTWLHFGISQVHATRTPQGYETHSLLGISTLLRHQSNWEGRRSTHSRESPEDCSRILAKGLVACLLMSCWIGIERQSCRIVASLGWIQSKSEWKTFQQFGQ